MTFQNPIDEYNHLTDQRNKLALRLKEIAAKKKELDERKQIDDGLSLIYSEAHKLREQSHKSIDEFLEKYGYTLDNLHTKDLTEEEIVFMFKENYNYYLIQFYSCAIINQFNLLADKRKIGNFCIDVKTTVRKFIDAAMEKGFMEAGSEIQKKIQKEIKEKETYMDNFSDLLKPFKKEMDEFRELTVEGKEYIKGIKKIEKRRRKLEPTLQIFHTYFKKYNSQSNYHLAHQQVRGFAKTIERNRKELVRDLANELHIIDMRYGSLELNLQSSFGNNYNSACRAYEILQKITDNTSSYKAMLAAKKDLLKICYCNNPKKEVGLFRKEVMSWNYNLEKRDAADILAAVRRLDEIAVMHLQKKSELKTQINELTNKLEILSKHKFL